jgi:peptide-methionine (S)-S-oxide reductase
MAQATFGAGCFWGVEVAFRQVPGVIDTTVGYAGGTIADRSYEQVCTRRTGHAEVVHVEYDPAQVRYEQLLDVFFANHDPTQLDRQGPDVDTQCRSAIFYHDENRRRRRARRRKLYRLPGAIVGRW